MKSLVINLLAAWAGTVESFQDGNVFRESNIDLQILSIADRLGYLKTAVDGKASLANGNIWTADQTIKPSAPGGQVALTLWRRLSFVEDTTDAAEALIAGTKHRIKRFNGSADQTITIAAEVYLIPTTTGNRIYSINPPQGGVDGRMVRIIRPRTADAHTVTIADVAAGVNLCQFPASQAGWVTLIYDGASATGAWEVLERSANLTAVSTNV